MDQEATQHFQHTQDCIDAIIAKVGKSIVFGMPLGLGKPYALVNALYHRAKQDASIKLKIVTAISLEKPVGRSQLEKNFLEPFVSRLFKDVPELDYVADVRAQKLPANVTVSEFFFKAGSFLNNPSQQQNFVYSNYTHAVRDLVINGVNVIAQMVAKKEIDGKTRYSFSCNPDLSLDIIPIFREQENQGVPVAIVGEVNSKLPFMYNHAQFEVEDVDMILDQPTVSAELFGVPHGSISPAEHMIGFYSSALVKDGGTLQVGIGSLGSALVYSTLLRHQHNDVYRQLCHQLELDKKFPVAAKTGGTGLFSKGLYGCSEMMVDGFIYLYRAGILTREVFDSYELQTLLNEEKISNEVTLDTLDVLIAAGIVSRKLRARDVNYLKKIGVFTQKVEYKGGSLLVKGRPIDNQLDDDFVREELAAHCLGSRLAGGIVVHGGFFLGPRTFYRMLHELTDQEHQKICMTSVNFINDLFDHRFGRQDLKVAQRRDARFINSTMMATLSGAAISDGLANGKKVSGVGGQYNFVAMAHEMNDSRSILCLKSTRQSGGKTVSNILDRYGHITIPAHLRDIFVTEYGIADVLGLPDRDVYIEMLKITDSRFQDKLLAQAKKNGKVPSDYQLPEQYRHNTPERILALLKKYKQQGHFPAFPFCCDFTEEELHLSRALKSLKAKTSTRTGLLRSLLAALGRQQITADIKPLLSRMQLDNPQNVKDKLAQRMLLAELRQQQV